MPTAEAAALLAAGALLALTLVLGGACIWAMARLRREAEGLRTARVEADAAAARLMAATARAELAATRLDVVGERVASERTGAASRLAYEALSGPVVKGLALATGVSQAARSLRSR